MEEEMAQNRESQEVYLLINTKAGCVAEASAALDELPGILFQDRVTGSYDIIAVVRMRHVRYINDLREACLDLHGVDRLELTLIRESSRAEDMARGHAWFP